MGTKKVLAGLSNAVLEQKELLKNNLQSIVDWAYADPTNFNPSSLFEKFSVLFGSDSSISKNLDQSLQIICGKRADLIENRRERILSEIPIKNVQAALRKIPPSINHLFAKNNLDPLIQSLGGTQSWLNVPSFLSKKPETKTYNQSRSHSKSFPYNQNQNKTNFHKNTKGENQQNKFTKPIIKKESKTKSEQPFRQKRGNK